MPVHVFDACRHPGPNGPCDNKFILHVSAKTIDEAWDKIDYERPEQVCACDRFTHIDSVPDGCDLPESPYPVISF
jgi:hypothetical protein